MENRADAGMSADTPTSRRSRKSTATQFFLKGLAISLPPILTLVILIWTGRLINDYIIRPASTMARWSMAQIIEPPPPTDELVGWDKLPPLEYCERNYRITGTLKDNLTEKLKTATEGAQIPSTKLVPLSWIESEIEQVYVPFADEVVPYSDYVEVAARLRPSEMPHSATGLYMELVTTRYFQSLFHLSAVAVVVTIVLLYFLGRMVTARLGAWVVVKFETAFLGRLPVISNVYSSVKQVTDFFFSERTIEYNRVVAFEYPRRGIWSIGFVTGESLLEITAAAGEPLLSVLVPTSPMPVTGYTMSIPRSEVLDLNITIDQAFQFCISCGVLVPPQQKVTAELLQAELAKRLTGSVAAAQQTTKKAVSDEPVPDKPSADAESRENQDPTEASS